LFTDAVRRGHAVLMFVVVVLGGCSAAGAADGGAVDWEDLALGPCPAATCLFLGERSITAADINDCGMAVLDPHRWRLIDYRLPNADADIETLFSTEPSQVPVAEEEQGEAVAYAPSGRTYYTRVNHW
jgi:hypothetical protein